MQRYPCWQNEKRSWSNDSMLTHVLPEHSYLCTVITTMIIPPPPRLDTHAHYTPATHACSVNTDMWYTMLNQTLWLIGCVPPLRFKVMLNPRSLLHLKLPWNPPCTSPTPSSHPSHPHTTSSPSCLYLSRGYSDEWRHMMERHVLYSVSNLTVNQRYWVLYLW